MAVIQPFSQNSNYSLFTSTNLVSQDAARKTSLVQWSIEVIRKPNPDWWAWSTTNMGNKGRADGFGGRELWENNNLAYDFRTVSTRWVFASGYHTVQHRSDGTGDYTVSASMTLINIGSASASTGKRLLPRLARIPDAPTPLYIDGITTDALRYRFRGNYDGGTPIREWQVQWQEAGGPTKQLWSNGTTTLSGLKPATLYTLWSRGRNDVGWGPWSPAMSARTKAGATVRHAGLWKDAVPMVKYKGVWRTAEPWVKVNGVWKRTGL